MPCHAAYWHASDTPWPVAGLLCSACRCMLMWMPSLLLRLLRVTSDCLTHTLWVASARPTSMETWALWWWPSTGQGAYTVPATVTYSPKHPHQEPLGLVGFTNRIASSWQQPPLPALPQTASLKACTTITTSIGALHTLPRTVAMLVLIDVCCATGLLMRCVEQHPLSHLCGQGRVPSAAARVRSGAGCC